MSLLFADEKLKRKANICHLLVSNVPEQELIDNYGYTEDEIANAKKALPNFDDFAYLQGKIKKSFHKIF